tara:strand:+ start:227 stop:421 length:195 start_codon:yes stop_codon:yes gene_type:complete
MRTTLKTIIKYKPQDRLIEAIKEMQDLFCSISSVRPEHMFYMHGVEGSNPSSSTNFNTTNLEEV